MSTTNSDVLEDRGGLFPHRNPNFIPIIRTAIFCADIGNFNHVSSLIEVSDKANKLAIVIDHVFHRGNSILAALAVASA